MTMNKQGNSMGISLILVVFILLSLITFGTLSFMLANSDDGLSISASENIIEFYDADMLAQEQLQDIDAILANAYEVAESEADYVAMVEEAFANTSNVEIVLHTDAETQEGDESQEEIEIKEGIAYLTFQIEVSDKEVLVCTLEILYATGDRYYNIESWILESNMA